ncbi:MAG: inositol monophosphatase family protein [Proteobacteria bacterium]|nr:inositol monophosphatase family protein [Pseudomonadota bacterium]
MDEVLNFAMHCAFESGKIQRKYFEKSINVRHKGEIDLVTDVDMACQGRIIELIKAAFPDDDIISEEKKNNFNGKKNRWIIDPLDGTTNYAHGYPFFCTSIAYEEDGQITLGVVYNPIFNELFFSRKGTGAYLNGETIQVSSVHDLKQALLSTGFPYNIATTERNNIDHFINFLFKAQAIRRDGSAALNLCYVACGRFDAFWELTLNSWDMAAGSLLINEAGGTVTNLEGNEFSVYKETVVASNGFLHEGMVMVLNGK